MENENLNYYNESQEEFDDGFKERLLNVIERSMRGESISHSDAVILFHWVRHKNEPMYDFVPEEYR